jgi:hypothetical protein
MDRKQFIAGLKKNGFYVTSLDSGNNKVAIRYSEGPRVGFVETVAKADVLMLSKTLFAGGRKVKGELRTRKHEMNAVTMRKIVSTYKGLVG